MTKDKNLKEKIVSHIGQQFDQLPPEESLLSLFENREQELKLKSLAQDIRERKKFAGWIYWMVVGWLIVILTIIVLVGMRLLRISDAVLLGLIGATTVNVTTFFVIVTKYLFDAGSST